MLIAVCTDKGSPGVTTSALALGSAWAGPAVVLEADPAGGDLGIRLRPGGSAMPEAPTVLTVATAARANQGPDLLDRYVHRLSKNLAIVPGAILREQMAGVGDWSPLADALARSETPVFADLGHLHSASPVFGIAVRADVVVAVSRPDATSVIRLRERLARLAPELGALRGAPPQLFALLVTTSRHGDANVHDLQSLLSETSARPFLVGAGFLAHDPAVVRRLESGDDPAGRLARTNLMRTARTVVEQLAALVGTQAPVPVGESAGGVRR